MLPYVGPLRAALADAEDDGTKRVRAYARALEDRAGVLGATECELAAA